MLISGTKGSKLFSGTDLKKAKQAISLLDTGKTDELRGAVAYPGQARGRACLVIDKKELSKIKKGCILVTPSTTVDYVPYLKKVAAIVTDEGGVLSHASVISRELRIPCVIGTKMATKVLKYGDTVEVNATEGKVKVIK